MPERLRLLRWDEIAQLGYVVTRCERGWRYHKPGMFGWVHCDDIAAVREKITLHETHKGASGRALDGID